MGCTECAVPIAFGIFASKHAEATREAAEDRIHVPPNLQRRSSDRMRSAEMTHLPPSVKCVSV